MKWNKIVTTCTDVAKEILGKKEQTRKYKDPKLETLSKQDKKLKEDIQSAKSQKSRIRKKEERKKIKIKIKKIIKTHKEEELEKELHEIEALKDDSNRYYKATKKLKNKNKTTNLYVQDPEGNFAGTNIQKIEIISNFFKDMLAPPTDERDLKYYQPTPMKTPFNKLEIEKAAKSLKNGKASGCDNLHAECIKYAPQIIYEEIAKIFNEVAEHGTEITELTLGMMTPLQKPGKKRGPPGNIRPIILLSVLRKILTICMLRRIWNRIEKQISIDQAAYQSGRGITEQVFSIKILAEKAVTSSNYELYLLLIDMSKAFDMVNRKILFEHLENTLEVDELHIMGILTNEPKLKVKIGTDIGNSFTTTKGILQGDCLSAILFVYYLSKCLKEKPKHTEHNYAKKQTQPLLISPKYADDITFISNDSKIIQEIEDKIPGTLAKYDLLINKSKTEHYTIPRPKPTPIFKTKEQSAITWSELDWTLNIEEIPQENTSPNWKSCRLLGSLLDTQADFERRKTIARNSMKLLTHIYNSKIINIQLKIRTFNAYTASIFLFNTELWSTPKTLEDKINSFQRNLLRKAIGIHWPRKITNEELEKLTKQENWNITILKRRLNWLGHLMRLDEETPARLALRQALKESRRPVGRPPHTWLKQIQEDLLTINIYINETNFEETLNSLAKNRKVWRDTVQNVMKRASSKAF